MAGQQSALSLVGWKPVVFAYPLTLQEAASGMNPEWQGGADSARPYKNQFRGHFDPIF